MNERGQLSGDEKFRLELSSELLTNSDDSFVFGMYRKEGEEEKFVGYIQLNSRADGEALLDEIQDLIDKHFPRPEAVN